MFRICFMRVACNLLAILTVVIVWHSVSPLLVNVTFDFAEDFVKAFARVVSSFTTLTPTFAESIVSLRMHLDRTMVMGLLMLVWMIPLAALTGGHIGWHVRRAFVTLLIVHAILLIAWLGWTSETAWWYDQHAQYVKYVLRKNSWDHAETIVIKVMQLHSLLVLLEAVVAYSVITSFFERSALDRHVAGHNLDRHQAARRH